MIYNFPKVNNKTKKKIIDWLRAQENQALAQSNQYKACHNESASDKASYQASTYASIIIHIEYHMAED